MLHFKKKYVITIKRDIKNIRGELSDDAQASLGYFKYAIVPLST
jgi:hypothetical protein